jgi:transcription elongation factor Elf1
MDEVEKFFKCPYCLEKISMLLDISIEEHQTYIEDCEVCCQPIQIDFDSVNGKIKAFYAGKTQ